MVRYHEIIKEDDQRIKYNLMNNFTITDIDRDNNTSWVKNENFEIKNGKVSVFNGSTCFMAVPADEFPVQFEDAVVNTFACNMMDLTTLKGFPIRILSHSKIRVDCSENNLTSLKYLPKKTIDELDCYENDLTSLEGIELDSEIGTISLDYTETLPMLRLLVAKRHINLVGCKIFGSGQQNPENIINDHIKQYPNIKERIIKCQYALIKAGLKGNAKW